MLQVHLPRCVGIARNERLLMFGAKLMRQAEQEHPRTCQKQRLFAAFDYAAFTWQQIRWVIAKAEHTDEGAKPRFVFTNIVGDPPWRRSPSVRRTRSRK